MMILALALALAVTGYLMTSGPNKESFEDIHELLANGFIIVVILHVSGIVLHSFRFKEMIALSMLDGKKDEVPAGQIIQTSRFGIGILFVCFVVSFGLYLVKNYDTQSRSLQFFGTALQLGENETRDQNGEAQDDD